MKGSLKMSNNEFTFDAENPPNMLEIHNVQSRFNMQHHRGTINVNPEKRAQQNMKEQVNINRIIERAKRGQIDIRAIGNSMPQYGDFTNITSYADAYLQVQAAQAEFNLLPAKIRDRFRNDPGQLIDFLMDNGNKAEAIELGLIKNEDENEPKKVGDPIEQ